MCQKQQTPAPVPFGRDLLFFGGCTFMKKQNLSIIAPRILRELM